MRTARRFSLTALSLLCSLLFTNAAFASHYYAEGYIKAASTSSNFLGGYSQWKTPSKYTAADGSGGGFIEETLWVGTQNISRSASETWAEVGLTKGWEGDASAWTMYWAEWTPTYNEYKITTVSPGSTGTNHRYQVQYDSYKTWGVYVDYTKMGTSSQSAGTMWIDNGSESTSSSNTLVATYPSYMQCLKSGAWTYWNSCGGTVSSSNNSPYKWSWLDGSTHKLGESYQ